MAARAYAEGRDVTLHYHGTPITPRSVLHQLAGRSFCVSFARPDDVRICHDIGESVMLDNGAFSVWRRGADPDWAAYYPWVENWLSYWTTWAVIPDSIDGGETENNDLINQWPHGQRGAPVWHLHEPIDRLRWLCDGWPRVCLGSSGRYRVVGDDRWCHRMDFAMNSICREGRTPAWLHMLRGMSVLDLGYPFASADSTDIAQNHNRPQNTAQDMAARWASINCPGPWSDRMQQEEMVI